MKRLLGFLLSLVIVIICASCSSTSGVIECNPIYSMDTIITIKFYNTPDYMTHYKEIKKIYSKYDLVSNDFEETSLLYKLNKERTVEANEALLELVNSAVLMKEDTLGYYNPFIGKITHKWKEAIENKVLPDSNEIATMLEEMKQTSVVIDGNTITLVGHGDLDLGGIAKGYATNKAIEYLHENNVNNYLINAGDSSVALGSKNGSDFTCELTKPYDNGAIRLVKKSNTCISTSSGKHQNVVIDGVRYHHLINPFTGYPANYYENVNVMCESALLGDVYSTAVFLMDEANAKDFAGKKNIDILLFNGNEVIYESEGWN